MGLDGLYSNMTYTPLFKINQAIGSPEADNLHTVNQLANDIIYDKTVLIGILHSFGVPASLADDLITLINKVAPISINYIELLSETFPDITVSLSGNGDSVLATLSSAILSAPPAETFTDQSASFSGDGDSGNMWLGGDATNTTKAKVFVVIDVIDGTTLQIDSTSGMSFGDSLTQGIYTTSLTIVVDSTHLIVGDTTGWVASSLVSTF